MTGDQDIARQRLQPGTSGAVLIGCRLRASQHQPRLLDGIIIEGLCGGWRVAGPECFKEAERYLWEAELVGQRRLTAEGREVMEVHGGSTAAFRWHLREGRKISGGDSYTTNITTGGGPAVVGNAGRMAGGEIRQTVAEKRVEYTADADAFVKIVAILNGLPAYLPRDVANDLAESLGEQFG